MAKSVVADLQNVLDLAVKTNETPEAFAERLARKANDMQEDDWETLDPETQLWVNAAIEAISRSEAIPIPSGITSLIPAGEAEEEAPKPKKEAKANGKKPVKANEQDAEEAPTKAAASKKARTGKAQKENEAPTRGPRGKFAPGAKIKILAGKNPFREGTKANSWFSLMKDGMTLPDAVEAGTPRNHIRWAHSLGHIKIG